MKKYNFPRSKIVNRDTINTTIIVDKTNEEQVFPNTSTAHVVRNNVFQIISVANLNESDNIISIFTPNENNYSH